MAKQATLIVLFLIFAAAIFIQYMLVSAPLSSIEAFKPKKKKSAKNKSGKKKSGKKKSGKKTSGKKKSGKKKSGKKTSAKKTSAKKTSAKKTSAKKTSAKKTSAKKPGLKKPVLKKPVAPATTTNKDYVNCPVGYTCSPAGSSPLAFSEVVGSLISPSLPDSRDMKDRLSAAVDSSYRGKKPSGCPSDSTNSAIASRQMSLPGEICPDANDGYDMNSYVKKDSIPCYGCSL